MSLGVTSGIVTIVSGPSQPQYTTENIGTEVYASGGRLSAFLGGDGNYALNVNISGGNVSVSISGGIQTQIPGLQSGSMVIISGGAGSLSGLNVTAAVSISPFAYQSGTEVGISGGQLALSGLYVIISGGVSSTIPALQSGTMVIISGGFPAGTPIPAYQSGTLVVISGGSPSLSGLTVIISGGAFSSNISGGVTVSGGVTISGGVTVSGSVAVLSGSITVNSGNVYVMSGVVQVSGQTSLPWVNTTIVQHFTQPITANSGGDTLLSGVSVTTTSFVIVSLSGNADMWLGSSGAVGSSGYLAISGVGLWFPNSSPLTLRYNNPNNVRVVAAISGQFLSFYGVGQ